MGRLEKEKRIKEALHNEDRFELNSKINVLDECIDDGFEIINDAIKYYKGKLKDLENK